VPLTRSQVVDAALEVLDDGGIDAVTVRSVAARLGVKAPALYWHVAGKQELLDEMGTEIQRRIMAAVPSPDEAGSWSAQAMAFAHAMRREYLRHKDGARTFSGTRLTDPAVLQAQEPLLAAWTAADLTLDEAVEVGQLIAAFVVGYVIEEQERAQSAPRRYDLDRRTDAVGEDFPLVARAGRVLAESPAARFDRLLDTILAGIESRVAARRR
jgi:TetR/AcrR family transcriptional regulator, tetracycline repressor protein